MSTSIPEKIKNTGTGHRFLKRSEAGEIVRQARAYKPKDGLTWRTPRRNRRLEEAEQEAGL